MSKWTLAEEEWFTREKASRLVRHLGHDPRNRKQLLLAAACLRRVWDWIPDSRSRNAVEVADGQASEVELRAACEIALQVFSDAATPLPREPHCKMYALPAEAVGMDDHIVDVVMYVAEATEWSRVGTPEAVSAPEERAQVKLAQDIFGNPFRPPAFDPKWRTADVVALAQAIYMDRAFDRLPILADARMDADCDDEQLIVHNRGDGPHVRGCWVVDLVMGKN